jgi:Protein of unknown function (DUF3108)
MHKFIASLLLTACGVMSSAHAQQSFTVQYTAEAVVDKAKASTTVAAVGGIFGGSVTVASVTDKVNFTKDSFAIESVASAGSVVSMLSNGNNSFVRTSKGSIANNTLNSLQFVDIRGKSAPIVALVNPGKTQWSFVQNKKVLNRAPYKAGAQDIASLMYAFIGRVPTAPFTTQVVDGKSIKTASFGVIKETVTVPSGKWDTVKLTRVNKAAGDAAIDLWLRASDGAPVRLRVGMNEKYGVLLDFKSTVLPATIAKY